MVRTKLTIVIVVAVAGVVVAIDNGLRKHPSGRGELETQESDKTRTRNRSFVNVVTATTTTTTITPQRSTRQTKYSNIRNNSSILRNKNFVPTENIKTMTNGSNIPRQRGGGGHEKLQSSQPQQGTNTNKNTSTAVRIPNGGGSSGFGGDAGVVRNAIDYQQLQSSPSSSPSALSNNNNLHNIKVGFYFLLWYGLNIYYNIINKQLLNIIPASIMIGTIQLWIGAAYAIILWSCRLRAVPTILSSGGRGIDVVALIRDYVPIGFCHGTGQLFSMVSLVSGPVSFTHIVKALEPFFSALVSVVMGEPVMPLYVYTTLLPVVGGVMYACAYEKSFTYLSFVMALLSNVSFAYRAVLSKNVMTTTTTSTTTTKEAAPISATNLFAVVTIVSAVLSTPVAIALEGRTFVSLWTKTIKSSTSSTSSTSLSLVQAILLTGLVHYLNNEVMYLALSNVHPITLAVGNTMKRVFIIFTALIVFQNPITVQAIIGSTIGIIGVLLYSLTKQHYDDTIKKRKEQQQAEVASWNKDQ
jgi:solute carrier family 35, member E1